MTRLHNGQQKRKLSRIQKVSLSLVSAACVFLIGGSCYVLANPEILNNNQPNQSQQTAITKDQAVSNTDNQATEEAPQSNESTAAISSDSSANSAEEGQSPSAPTQESQAQTNQTRSDTVTVSVSVSSSAADGRVSGGANPTFTQGATAYDALCTTGLSVSAVNSSYGIYVRAIGGLAEKEFGGSSGWMYSVNGITPQTACSNYVLKNGDAVSWYYVV